MKYSWLALLTLAAAPAVGSAADMPLLELDSEPFYVHEGVHPAHYHPRLSLAVIGDSVWVQRSKLGDREYVFEYSMSPSKSSLVNADLFADREPLGQSFVASGGRVVFYDGANQEIVLFDPSGGVEEIPTGHAVVRAVGLFRDGNLLVSSNNMYREVVQSWERRERPGQTNDDALADYEHLRESLDSFDLFLVDRELNVLRPVASKRQVEVRTDEPRVADKVLNGRRIRVDPDGTRAVVFSKHRPELLVVDQNGDEVGVYSHVGKGRSVEPEEPLSKVLPVGTTVYYQEDAVLAGSDLWVADAVNNAVWRIDLDTGAQDGYHVPFRTASLQATRSALYLLDTEGELHRMPFSPGQPSTR